MIQISAKTFDSVEGNSVQKQIALKVERRILSLSKTELKSVISTSSINNKEAL